MDHTGKIKRRIKQRFHMMKALGVLFWIPILINDILTPGMVYITYMHYGMDEHTFHNIVYYVQIVSPFFSTFWIYVHLVKYIDTKGNEIFYISNRVKANEILFLYVLYMITNTVPFLWYIKMYSKLVWEWLHLAIVYFFLVSMAYFVCYLFRSVAIAIFPILCYTFLAITKIGGKVPVWSYYEPNGMASEMMGTKYFYFLLLGSIAFISGCFLNKKYTDY